LLGDPNAARPRGTISSATLTGTKGSSSPNISSVGTLIAGDYIQLGTGENAKLHKVLQGAPFWFMNTGHWNTSGLWVDDYSWALPPTLPQDFSYNGTIEIWPSLRDDYTDEPVIFTNTAGLFRRSSSNQGYSINSSGKYNISFDCVEVV
jgi:hypothetical protein